MQLHFIGRSDAPQVLFAHGWGRTRHDFIPVAESLAGLVGSTLLDLPGFGDTPRPEGTWDTAAYAAHVHAAMVDAGRVPYVWVGHSFGGRLGLRTAVAQPDTLSGLVLVAAAGIPRRRTAWEQARARLRGAAFRWQKALAKDEAALLALEARYGSADYVASREAGMRDIFLATIAEDQTRELRRITTPTRLIWGGRDTETPPETGRRMARLIPGAGYVELPEFDHISILDRGRFQIARAVRDLALGGPGA